MKNGEDKSGDKTQDKEDAEGPQAESTSLDSEEQAEESSCLPYYVIDYTRSIKKTQCTQGMWSL